MRVIAIASQKGGVGKTTAAVNLGHSLALDGQRVVLADLDAEGYLAACLGIHAQGHGGMGRVLAHGEAVAAQLLDVRDNLALIPAGAGLAAFDSAANVEDRLYLLRDAFVSLEETTDYLILDCPPSSGLLTMNAVMAAHDVLTPVVGDYLSLTGLARLMLLLKRLGAAHGGELREWVFFSRFTPRRRLSQEVYAKVAQHFPDRLLCSGIQEAAVLDECAAAGKTIFEYRGSCRAAREFLALADDLLNARVVGNEQETNSHVA